MGQRFIDLVFELFENKSHLPKHFQPKRPKKLFPFEENRQLCHLQKKRRPLHFTGGAKPFFKKTNWLLGEEAFDSELSLEFLSSKHLCLFRHPSILTDREESLYLNWRKLFLSEEFSGDYSEGRIREQSLLLELGAVSFCS
ncbi:hypothetical protein CEXT_737931 [Caerostris extrusa]|uniref:Uncharacterized protein n=1 Tax=Caerostris extrusa TaxID=172846 RepID=A0AAV4XY65_CAEEX|nr:hypothetical protein CEXT_737931 [Caerostris extrusa]